MRVDSSRRPAQERHHHQLLHPSNEPDGQHRGHSTCKPCSASTRRDLRVSHAHRTPAGFRRTSGSLRGARSGGNLVACALLCTVGALLLGPQLESQSFRSVEGLKALKSLAKTFVYQQLTQRKNFVPLPVPIPVPIEINEPPVFLKGKPKYVNVYKPKPTAAPAPKPTTVYHMPIYSPTYEYMSMDPMSSMYGHVAPVVYPAPYGKQPAGSSSAGYKASLNSAPLPEDADPASGGSSTGAMMNFNDYDDDSSQYYMGRLARRRSKLVAANAGDYISGASLELHQRKDDTAANYHDAAAAASSTASQQQQQQQSDDLATSASSNVNSVAPVSNSDENSIGDDSNGDHDNDDEDDERDSIQTHNDSDSISSPNDDDESYDHEQDSAAGSASLRRSKRQVYYQSGYDGKQNCEGLPIEINMRSRIKLDQIFPIYGKSQMRKCVKPKKPFHILPPPEEHY